jgi:hypothetical protein
MNIRLFFLPILFVAGLAQAQQGEKVWRPYDTVTRINRGTGEAPPEDPKGFDLNKVFVGGSVGLGLGFGSVNSSWGIGAYPQIGYSLADWVDAGIIFNANFNSQKYNNGSGDYKTTSFNYGTGAFVRLFPFKSFFIQAQPEVNWIAYKEKYQGETNKVTVNAPSMLVGVGFGQRMTGESGFFTTIMIDVLTERYSPYRNYDNSIIPVVRAGYYVYLGRNKNRTAEDY